MQVLLKLESQYGFNTKDVVNNTATEKEDRILPNDVFVYWYNTYGVFKDYGGNDACINTQD